MTRYPIGIPLADGTQLVTTDDEVATLATLHRLDETGPMAWQSRRMLPRSMSEAELVAILAGA